MASDIAQLGIVIDSRPVKDATAALTGLAAAAKPAAAAADALSHSHAGLDSASQAAFHSMRSLLEQMVSGVPITTALGQQLSHLSFIAQSPGGLTGAFGNAAKAITSLASPAVLVGGALAAVAAGGVLAIHSLVETGKQFDDTAHQTGTTIDQLHALATAAAFKGIDNSAFLKGMDRFSTSVYQAQQGVGNLAEVFRANNVSASTFTDYVGKAADLIKNATSDQQRLVLLQQMGLPATMDWVRFLSQGAAGIKAAQQAAADFNASAEGQLVASARHFDDEWNSAWANFSNNSKSALLSAFTGFSSLYDKADALAKKVGNSSFWQNFIPAGSKPENFGLQSLTGDNVANGRVSTAFSTLASQPTNNSALAQGLANTAAKLNGDGGTKDKDTIQALIARQQPLLGLLGQAQPAATPAKEKESDSDSDRVRLPVAA